MEKAAAESRIASTHTLTRREAGFEFMLNALRLNEGFPVALFAQHTGLPLTVVERPLREAEEKGLIQWDMHHIRPTELGRRFLNALPARFLPEGGRGGWPLRIIVRGPHHERAATPQKTPHPTHEKKEQTSQKTIRDWFEPCLKSSPSWDRCNSLH